MYLDDDIIFAIMANACFSCQKKSWHGNRSRHHKGVAGASWKHKAQKSAKLFKVNVHKIKVMFGGVTEKIKLCTDCISLIRKRGQLVVASQVFRLPKQVILTVKEAS